MIEREFMEYDVVIVGAGPSGLSAAIKLKQLSKENNKDISVCVIEKGSEVGSHILSGAVIETKALDELIPNWKSLNSPLKTQAKEDKFLYLTETKSYQFHMSEVDFLYLGHRYPLIFFLNDLYTLRKILFVLLLIQFQVRN